MGERAYFSSHFQGTAWQKGQAVERPESREKWMCGLLEDAASGRWFLLIVWLGSGRGGTLFIPSLIRI